MTSAFRLHDTVIKVSSEAKSLIPQVPSINNETSLLSQLILCILSSQEKYEVALGVMKEFKKNKIIIIPKGRLELKKIHQQIITILSHPVCFTYRGINYSRRIRFFLKKANYIVSTIERIYFNNLTIKKILQSQTSVQDVRNNLIANSMGIGPKQASMFLRNVGFHTDFAILDKHVVDYMKLMGLTCGIQANYSNLHIYQKVETELRTYADNYNISLFHLDIAIWTTMRTIKTKKA